MSSALGRARFAGNAQHDAHDGGLVAGDLLLDVQHLDAGVQARHDRRCIGDTGVVSVGGDHASDFDGATNGCTCSGRVGGEHHQMSVTDDLVDAAAVGSGPARDR
jgi:hypothetical protein